MQDAVANMTGGQIKLHLNTAQHTTLEFLAAAFSGALPTKNVTLISMWFAL